MSLFVVSFISFFSWFASSSLGKRSIEKHNKLIINKIRKVVKLFAQHLHNILQNCSTDSSHQFCLIFKDNYIIFRQFENFSISLQSIKYFSYQEKYRFVQQLFLLFLGSSDRWSDAFAPAGRDSSPHCPQGDALGYALLPLLGVK